ncbi:MAG: hypothetical protein L6R19_18920 [Alphaproteobacteria bacterium]|nr:hypothetical protein [Alphaproteobacteria bacterium]
MVHDIALQLQTIYAELLDRAQAAAFEESFADQGTFVAKSVKGRRYWYLQSVSGGRKQQRYAGPETPELLERIALHREHRDDARERRALVATLVRSAHLPRPAAAAGPVLAALAQAGVFRLRGVLVGTVAYQSYAAMLGVRLPQSTLLTADIDIAQDRAISVAVGDRIESLLDVLRRADPAFQPVPLPRRSLAATSYAAPDVRVEFLTPNRGRNSDAPTPLPALGTHGQQLRFLDFLIRDPEPAVVLHGPGIPVLVPAPQRYALHKLIVAQRRAVASTAKARKDLAQAEALIDVLARRRPHELRDAWDEARSRGRKWREHLAKGLDLIAPEARAAIGMPV